MISYGKDVPLFGIISLIKGPCPHVSLPLRSERKKVATKRGLLTSLISGRHLCPFHFADRKLPQVIKLFALPVVYMFPC